MTALVVGGPASNTLVPDVVRAAIGTVSAFEIAAKSEEDKKR